MKTPASANPLQVRGPLWQGLALAASLHVALVAGLLSYSPAHPTLAAGAPLMIEFIREAEPAQPESPARGPKPPEVSAVRKTLEPVKIQPGLPAQSDAPSAQKAAQPAEPARAVPAVETRPAAAVPAPSAPLRAVSEVEYLRAPQPQYPGLSRRMGEEGRVTVRILVDVQGRPERAEIQKSSGSPRLDAAARNAVMQALFKPHVENGQPVPVWAIVPISFSLQG